MRWNIPERFVIANHTYSVRWMTPAEEQEYEAEGVCIFKSAEILLKTGGSKDWTDHTFMHELTHAILTAMGSKKTNDEGFVDSFSGLLHQFFKSKKGKLE